MGPSGELLCSFDMVLPAFDVPVSSIPEPTRFLFFFYPSWVKYLVENGLGMLAPCCREWHSLPYDYRASPASSAPILFNVSISGGGDVCIKVTFSIFLNCLSLLTVVSHLVLRISYLCVQSNVGVTDSHSACPAFT